MFSKLQKTLPHLHTYRQYQYILVYVDGFALNHI